MRLSWAICGLLATVAGPAFGQEKIEDSATMEAFRASVNSNGFNCPQIVSVLRLNYQTERGQPFMVACGGSAQGFYYRVTVQPRGAVSVEPWK